MACQAATHEIHIDAGRGVVIKRFRSWDRREPVREWTALMLLAEYAPGLAATPVRADLTADPPVIEMSRLPGVPLGGTTPSAPQADALGLALDRADWFFGATLDTLNGGDVVLGQGDANLANFLWDGTQVRIVDFEDSGPSDRAFELAVLVEHIPAWSDAGLPAEVFLALFDLTAAEQMKLREYRRLSALFWLLMLLPGSPAHRRNPPGTLERQAARLLLLLDCGCRPLLGPH
jgi:Phosphotransferase enzyme family